MAKLNVSPTRMVLAELKRRLATAQRGHKLLKDKQDELMREFIESIRRNAKLRDAVEEALRESMRRFLQASAVMSPEYLEEAVSYAKTRLLAETTIENHMSVRVPRYRFVRQRRAVRLADSGAAFLEDSAPAASEGDAPTAALRTPSSVATSGSGGQNRAEAVAGSPEQVLPTAYGYGQTSADLDAAILGLDAVMEQLLELAEVEKSCQLMADEIESTRRRVNALEYRTIPDLEETIKYIRMKLDENERSTITRLMKVKDIISKEA